MKDNGLEDRPVHWADHEESKVEPTTFEPFWVRSPIETERAIRWLEEKVERQSRLINQLYHDALKEKGIRK